MMYSCREQSQHKIRYQGISVGKHQFGTHGTCSLSYKKDQEQRGDMAQLYVVEEAAGHLNLRQGHWGHPVTTADKRAGHWGLHPVKPSGAANPSARAAKLSVAEGNLVGGVGIEHGEHLNDVLTGIVLAHLAGHHVDELLELDGAVAVTVDVLNHGRIRGGRNQAARRSGWEWAAVE
jgi:hypothetical protein